jgi:hypothetical protein
MSLWSFQGARGTAPALRYQGDRLKPVTAHDRPTDGLSKLNSVVDVEVDVLLGELGHRTIPKNHRRTERLRSNGSGFPRKEVIQPQLPLRLPCYDFTPIINPTFDGSLPCGLGHRLRVLPTFVV